MCDLEEGSNLFINNSFIKKKKGLNKIIFSTLKRVLICDHEVEKPIWVVVRFYMKFMKKIKSSL
jgi:hypothetical protein